MHKKNNDSTISYTSGAGASKLFFLKFAVVAQRVFMLVNGISTIFCPLNLKITFCHEYTMHVNICKQILIVIYSSNS